MIHFPLPHWLNRTHRNTPRRQRQSGAPTCHRCRPVLECLEGRCVPSTVTNLNDAGAGSLRQAIIDTPAGGTVDFQEGLTGTINLTSGGLAINNDLTINGPGAAVLTVSGNQASQVFDITGAFNVAISGLTVADGMNSGDGGGIMNSGTLAVDHCTFTGNSATLNGGGIWNAGTLTVTASTFTSNQAGQGGAVYGEYKTSVTSLTGCTLTGNSATYGAAIETEGSQFTLSGCTVNGNTGGGAVYTNAGLGTLIVTDCTVSNNNGGGIDLDTVTNPTITNSTISGNTADYGAGISNGGSSGTTIIANCTISGNTATQNGGGITANYSVDITNCTISGNSAGAQGGGIDATYLSAMTVTNCTISGNSAGAGGGICNNDTPLGTVTLGNSIVAGNTASSGPDVRGPMASQGYNLIGMGSGGSGFVAADYVGSIEDPLDPRLGPLQNNGGPTATMVPQNGSVAIDDGDNALSPGPYDQRGPGFPRVLDGTIDIGAIEVQAPVPVPLVVRNTNDSGPGSLRQATLDANSSGGDSIITVVPTLTGTISLVTALPNLTSNIDLIGPGANSLSVMRATNTFMIIYVEPGVTDTISGLTLTGGGTGGEGGAIDNNGTLTVNNCTISDSSAYVGGGIYNKGTMTLTGSTVVGNTAASHIVTTSIPSGLLGPPMTVPGTAGGIFNDGTMTIVNCTIAANTAPGGFEGGILNDGMLTLSSSTVALNTANAQPGIANGGPAADLVITNTIVAENQGSGSDFNGSLTSGGNNLIGDGTFAKGFGPTDLVGTSTAPVDPKLGPLQYNGGPTETMALLPGSPAIDAGNTAASPGTYDQRGTGFPRVVNSIIDIGAFESETNLTVRNLNDSGAGSLRQALLDANSLAGNHIINFAGGVTGTISLATALPSLSANIDLEGPGANILTVTALAPNQLQIFDVAAGATDTIAGLTITGGSAAILNSNGSFILNSNGGGILNNGTLTVNYCTIAGNSAHMGGGIANTGTMTLNSCTVSGNTAPAIPEPTILMPTYVNPGSGAGIDNEGTMTIVNCTIADNTSVGGGDAPSSASGILNGENASSLTISNSTVAFNVAKLEPPLAADELSALTPGAEAAFTGGIANQLAPANLVLYDTIVANNQGGSSDVRGEFTSQGNNLIGAYVGGTSLLPTIMSTDLVGTSTNPIDPKLGPLQNNGGPTPTMALLSGSPALGAGGTANAPPWDQRGPGFPRIVNGRIDIGAFEVQQTAMDSVVGVDATTGQWWVAKSTGTSFQTSLWDIWSTDVTWINVQTGDFTGDGSSDIIGMVRQTGQWFVGVPNGQGQFTTREWDAWNPAYTWKVLVGDFTGDGKDDIAGYAVQTGRWFVGLSTGTSFTTSLWDGWNASVPWANVMVGDMTGDGKADIVAYASNSGQWWVGVSTGSSFHTSLWDAWNPNVTWVNVQLGDFNGDGRMDLVGRVQQSGQWWVGLSTGSSFQTSLWDVWSTGVTWLNVVVGDFNGDGKDDIVGQADNGQWWCGVSTGTGFQTSLWDAWSTGVTWVDVQVGDFNGDGLSDIVARAKQTGQWYVGLSNGQTFTTSLWDAWNPAVSWADVQTLKIE